MKYLKMLGLLAVATAASTAIAGTASATTLTQAAPAYTGPLQAVNESALELHGPIGAVICKKSVIEGNVEAHGAGAPASGSVATLDLSECGQHHVKVVKAGSLSFTASNSFPNGNLTWTGTEITMLMTTIFGAVHCIYATNQTPIGTVTGATSPTGHATLDIEGVLPRVVTNPLCGYELARWTGSYKFTTPTGLQIH